MAFCKKCGAQLKDGAKFCTKCGTSVEGAANAGTTSETRKQVFVNSAIRKCPHCGAEISSDAIKCPECGFLLERENVNSSLDEFVKKFTSIYDNEQKRVFVESYAVPNNKEVIRDFLNYAKSQRDKDYIDDATKVFWVDAWNNKCRQLVTQASNTFGDDSDFILFLRRFNDEIKTTSETNALLKEQVQKEQKADLERDRRKQEKAEKEERNYRRREERRRHNEEFEENRSTISKFLFPKIKPGQIIGIIVVLILSLAVMYWFAIAPTNKENKRLENLETEISQDIQNGNLEDAAFKLEGFKYSEEAGSGSESSKWEKKREVLQKQLELKQQQSK